MSRYIIKRLLMLIVVIFGVSVVIFTIMYFTPGDPVKMSLGEGYTQEQYDAKEADLGLDQPYVVQLVHFLKQTFIDFDLGTSYFTNASVKDQLLARLPRTAIIATICCILQVVIAIPLGITAATHQNGFWDRFCIFIAMLTVSIPSFWFAMILILIFSLKFNLLPSSGIDGWYSYILPCLANCMISIGGLARLTRSQMLEVIHSDYVVTARAKGVSERKILYSHALPNALIPVVTNIGTHFGMSLGGTVVIETVFAIPGVGYYMMQAVSNRDYPIVRGGVTLLAVLFSVVVLLIDLLYAYIDPRIKAQYEGQSKKRIKIKKGSESTYA